VQAGGQQAPEPWLFGIIAEFILSDPADVMLAPMC
jgi:hypothetical protein